jgi:DUF4097 and DUF4098 domain-containing protein YvlB
MRRGSIVGPLLLITVGGLFLANNLRPDLSLFQVIAEYWPYLLIAWGVLRLIEIGAWFFSGKTLPQRGISSGEWTFVVFLALIGSGMFAVHRHWGFSPLHWRIQGLEMFGEPFDFGIDEQKVACGKTPRVIIENFRGNARVTGTDTDEVKLTGRKTIRAMRLEDAQSGDRSTQVELVRDGDVITVRTNQERADSRMRINTDLEISVPRGATIQGRGRVGDFDVTDLNGNIEIESENAGVRVQNVGGNLKCNLRKSDIIRAVTVKGGVDLRVSGQSDNLELEDITGPVTVNGSYYELQFRKLNAIRFDGTATNFRVEKCPGEIRMTPNSFNADNVVGPLTLNTTRSKDVEISGATQGVSVTLDRGDIEVRASKDPVPKMDLRTRNGDITVALPERGKFSLRGATQHGEVTNEFGDLIQVNGNERNASFSGRVGDGPELLINTDRGTINLRKATGEMMAEEPPSPPKAPRVPKPTELKGEKI